MFYGRALPGALPAGTGVQNAGGNQELLLDLPLPTPLCCPSIASQAAPGICELLLDPDPLFFLTEALEIAALN